MTLLALGLLLLSAALHATWNLLLKQAQDKQAAAWWAMLFGAALFLPALAFFPPLPASIWPFVLGTANTAWNFDPSAATTTIYCSMVGRKIKG